MCPALKVQADGFSTGFIVSAGNYQARYFARQSLSQQLPHEVLVGFSLPVEASHKGIPYHPSFYSRYEGLSRCREG
ncbi:hypothetical protein H5410_023269 [Solanum commersonii]|uniref:Uncharacterized protein n=1 Tax=Solanum commersonii TaxID=4109 RepID=A0A9J5ZJC8_SOLCO|nr:hypothetical protein H5410_023269 [Solanum commersonii]